MLRNDEIRLNAVILAEVMRPLYRRWLDTFDDPHPKLYEITSRVPLGKRMTEAEKIAKTVLFALSNVSSHTTGL